MYLMPGITVSGVVGFGVIASEAKQSRVVALTVNYPEFPAALPRGLRFGKFENLRFSTILEA
jgi:hypothetical protein